jgi:rhodanese-related sulfurtransferase
VQLKWSLRRVIDVAILLLLLITGWRVVDAMRDPHGDTARASALTPAVKPGDVFRLPGVVWSAPRTVVLVLSTTCPACNDNLPFYRQVSAAASPEVQVVAVSHQPVVVVGEWLRRHQVSVRSIHNVADPPALGLTLTPMVLIVDAEGRVTDVMIRKLAEPDQVRTLARIRDAAAAAVDNSQQMRELSASAVEELTSLGRIQIVDVRPRQRFQAGHRSGARNIPYPELSSRAPIELDVAVPVVVDCLQPVAAARCRSAGWVLIAARFDDVSILIR